MDREPGRERSERPVRPAMLLLGLLVAALLVFEFFVRPLAAEIQYSLAQWEFHHRRTEAGLMRLDQSLVWNPHSYAARYRRAVILYLNGRYPEAIEEARRALDVHSKLEVAYWVMGSAYLKMGETQMAKAMFLKALDINPHYPHALHNLGVRAMEEGRAAEAESLLLRAAEGLGLADVNPYLNLATLYEAVGRRDRALEMYATAVTIEPYSGSHWYQVARLRALTGNPGEALDPLTRAVSLDPALRERAARDPAFAALRDRDPRMRALLHPPTNDQ